MNISIVFSPPSFFLKRKYYLKNKSLKIGLNLSKYVYNEDWEGVLRVDSYTNNAYDDYTMSDIHEKIILTYYGSA